MKTYKDYCDHLDKLGLLEGSVHRQIHFYECEWIAHYMDLEQPKYILEIGRNRGHSLGLLRFCAPEAYIVSVDPAHHKHADLIVSKTVSNMNYELIDGTIDNVDRKAWDSKFDFVLIDGDHRFAGVNHDWEIVNRHLVHDGSCVVFDNLAIPAVDSVFKTIRGGHRKSRPCEVPGWNPEDKGTFGVVHINKRLF